MTTNYYLHTGICEYCGRPEEIYHIGLSAAGWQFLFKAYNFKEGETPQIRTIKDWNVLINNSHYKIFDEYDQEKTPEWFWDFVKTKQQDGQSHVELHGVEGDYIDEDGYNFSERDFS